MLKIKSQTPSLPAPSPSDISLRWRAGTLLLAFGAAACSLVLLQQALSGLSLPGCDGSGSSCDQVFSSRYSQIFRLPVGALALGVYGGLFLVLLSLVIHKPTRRKLPDWCWPMFAGVGASIVGAAAWFMLVQAVLLRAFCVYCTITHALGLALSAALIHAAFRQQARKSWVICVALGLSAAALLALAQVLGPEPRTLRVQQLGGVADIDTGPGPHRTISILGGKVRLNPHEYPVLGNPDAPHVAVYLYDYTCVHCREMSLILQQAQRRYGNQLAIVLLPVPLDAECNANIKTTSPQHAGACDLAKLVLGVWRVAPEQLPSLHHLMMRDSVAPSPQDVNRRLRESLDPQALSTMRFDRWPAEQIKRNTYVLELTGSGAIPRLILGSMMISSRPATPEELFNLLETQTTLRPSSNEPRP